MKGQYCWAVTMDHTSSPQGIVVGPKGCDLNIDTIVKNGIPFRMLDDDDELYYEGYFLGADKGENMFGPLDDYGSPNAGCTYIQYRNKLGEWETL